MTFKQDLVGTWSEGKYYIYLLIIALGIIFIGEMVLK